MRGFEEARGLRILTYPRFSKDVVNSIILKDLKFGPSALPQHRESVLILHRSRFKLSSREELVTPSTDEAPVLSLPDECKGEEKDDESDGADGVEDVCYSYCIDPGDHGEDEDG